MMLPIASWLLTVEGFVPVPGTALELGVPETWVELNDALAVQDPTGEAKRLLDSSRAQGIVMMFLDPDVSSEGFSNNVNASVRDCAGPMDEDFARKLADRYAEGIPGGAWTKKGVSLETISGVDVPRVEGWVHQAGQQYPQVQFVVPDGPKCATVTWTGAPSQWPALGPKIEGLMAETRGVAEPEGGGFDWGRVGRGGMNGAVLGAAGGLLLGLIAWGYRRFTTPHVDDDEDDT